jgi:hypothetical protein
MSAHTLLLWNEFSAETRQEAKKKRKTFVAVGWESVGANGQFALVEQRDDFEQEHLWRASWAFSRLSVTPLRDQRSVVCFDGTGEAARGY